MHITKNLYCKHSKISEAKFRRVIKAFAMDLSASDAAALTRLDVRSVNRAFLKIRARIAQHCEHQRPCSGEVELDESHFGPRRVRGKVPVFGLLKRDGRVCAMPIADARSKTLMPIIRRKASRTAWFIPIHFAVIMCWIYLSLSICVLIIAKCLPTSKITSTALRIFGARRSGNYASLTGFRGVIFRCF